MEKGEGGGEGRSAFFYTITFLSVISSQEVVVCGKVGRDAKEGNERYHISLNGSTRGCSLTDKTLSFWSVFLFLKYVQSSLGYFYIGHLNGSKGLLFILFYVAQTPKTLFASTSMQTLILYFCLVIAGL